MPFRTNCPSCGKDMLLLESMFGKPKRCRHCEKIFRVGGGTLPTEAELAVVEKRREEVIPLVDDRRDRPVRRFEDDLPPRKAKGGAPLWVVLLSIGGLVAALGVTGFLIWKATSDRGDTQPRAADAKKTDDSKAQDQKDDRKPADDGPILPREDPIRNPIVPREDPIKNPPPPRPARLTVDKFRMLRMGMPEAAATEILGKWSSRSSGTRRDPATKQIVAIVTLTWRDATGIIQLRFVNDQLINGSATLNGINLPLGG